MTDIEKERAIDLRKKGLSYGKIANELDLKVGTVKVFFHRLKGESEHNEEPKDNKVVEHKELPARNEETTITIQVTQIPCKNCSSPVVQYPGRKEKKFCSDACRISYWNKNRFNEKHGKMNEYVCSFCGKVFYSYKSRKYCSAPCYFLSRFGRYKETTV